MSKFIRKSRVRQNQPRQRTAQAYEDQGRSNADAEIDELKARLADLEAKREADVDNATRHARASRRHVDDEYFEEAYQPRRVEASTRNSMRDLPYMEEEDIDPSMLRQSSRIHRDLHADEADVVWAPGSPEGQAFRLGHDRDTIKEIIHSQAEKVLLGSKFNKDHEQALRLAKQGAEREIRAEQQSSRHLDRMPGLTASDLRSDLMRKIGEEQEVASAFGQLDEERLSQSSIMREQMKRESSNRNKSIKRQAADPEEARQYWESMDMQKSRSIKDVYSNNSLLQHLDEDDEYIF